MSATKIEILRHHSHKLIRELSALEANNIQHWHALLEISQNPQITISKLAQILVMHISNASRAINLLIDNGFVHYAASNHDQRQKHLILTKKGEDELKQIEEISNSKILNAFRFLGAKDQEQIIEAIKKYTQALEKSRLKNEFSQIKIRTLSTSRTLRKEVKSMVDDILKNEFHLPIIDADNSCIMQAEKEFCYNNSCNFWYALDDSGRVIGSIGLQKLDRNSGLLKKFYVKKEYRGQNVSKALIIKLLDAAKKHKISNLYLGTVENLRAAIKFYEKYGFVEISKKSLPKNYTADSVDTLFFKGNTKEIFTKISIN